VIIRFIITTTQFEEIIMFPEEYIDEAKQILLDVIPMEPSEMTGSRFLTSAAYDFLLQAINNIIFALWEQLIRHPYKEDETLMRKNRRVQLKDVFERFSIIRAMTMANIEQKRVFFGKCDPRCSTRLLPASQNRKILTTLWVDPMSNTIDDFNYYLQMIESTIHTPLYDFGSEFTFVTLNAMILNRELLCHIKMSDEMKYISYPSNWEMIRQSAVSSYENICEWNKAVQRQYLQ